MKATYACSRPMPHECDLDNCLQHANACKTAIRNLICGMPQVALQYEAGVNWNIQI